VKRPPMRRLIALFAFFAFALTSIVVRLAVLQVSRAEAYQTEAMRQRVSTITLPAWRGRILDRSGEPLAMSVPARDIYADPTYVDAPSDTAKQLASILGVRARPHLAAALGSDATFVYVARDVPMDLAERVEALHLPGIDALPVSARSYPAGAVASQTLGTVDVDGRATAGLEMQYDDQLSGRPGERTWEHGPDGRPIVGGIDVERPPVPGADVETTIDRDFQYQVQAALAQDVRMNHARGGTVIVMDPHSGDVYAMATYPWFDPNDPGASPVANRRNRPIVDIYEPGSTNKVITAAAAVQEHVISLRERLTVPWTMRVGDYTIHDSHPHAPEAMTLGDIVAQSSNIGAVMIADRLGAARMARYLSAFGLGRPTGVDFPYEAPGMMLPLSQWSDSSLATMAYGQGIAVTPLQMVSVFATIANGGVWVQPRLVRGTIEGGRFEAAPNGRSHRVVSAETAHTVTRMLAYAVADGTGLEAQIGGFEVAGKTGTARIPKPGGGYYTDRSIASFMGFLPAGDPKVVIAAILDQPTTVYGGTAAAPLFRTVARYAIERLGLTPAAPVGLPPHALPAR
jgi:cell division protein FtsI (penicillin-binding protein 3)